MGPDALQSFQRGIQIMSQDLRKLQLEYKTIETQDAVDVKQNKKKDQLLKETKKIEKELSSGYVSAAELYMNDLCAEDKAEFKCASLLQQALSICPTSAEAHHSLSELRLAQSKTEENIGDQARQHLVSQAIVSLEECLKLIKNSKESSEDYQSDCDFNLKVAILALDLKQYKAAARLADKILKQDDTVIEAWSVAGISNLRRGKLRLANLYLTQASQKYAKEAKEGELNDEEKVAQANVELALRENQKLLKAKTKMENEEVEESSDEEDNNNNNNNNENDIEMTDSLSNSFISLNTSSSSSNSSSVSASTKSSTVDGRMRD